MNSRLNCVMMAIVVLILVAMPYGSYAEDGNLYDMYEGKGLVKVYVDEIHAVEGIDAKDVQGLKGMIEDALVERKSLDFGIVRSKEEADIIIDVTIREKIWMSEDPVDMITGIGPIIFDALKKENYVRMQALFTVTNAQTGEMVWEDVLKATITKKKIEKDEASQILEERIVKIFLRECCSKNS